MGDALPDAVVVADRFHLTAYSSGTFPTARLGGLGEVAVTDRRQHLTRLGAAVVVAGMLSGMGLFAGAGGDSDGDGLSNCAERSGLRSTTGEVWRTSAQAADTDGDGIRDGDEVVEVARPSGFISAISAMWTCDEPTYRALSSPALSDSDHDGLNDAVELSEGSDVFDSDSDDDGLTDQAERQWGSDPNAADTDGDGRRDGDDVTGGASPIQVEERVDRESWISEFREGVTWGDSRDIDTVAQLVGAISVSAASTVPVVGWVAGTVADLRDIAVDLRQREWASALVTSSGLLPYVGDTAKATGYISTFAKRYPGHIRTAMTAIAQWDRVPMGVRARLIEFGIGGGPTAQLRNHGLSDADIVAFARNGANLAKFARALNTAAGVVRSRTADGGQSPTDPTSVVAAGVLLRAQMGTRAETSPVSEAPVYVKIDAAGGPGRLVDACTRCAPRPLAGHSELRFAKYGPQHYSATTQNQIDRDVALIRAGFTVEWHLFLDGGTDIDPGLLDALDRGAVPYVVHLPR